MIKLIYTTFLVASVVPACTATVARASGLTPAGPDLCEGELVAAKLNLYYSILNEVIKAEEPVLWVSERLKAGRVAQERAGEIIDLVLDEDPLLIGELDAFISGLGGMASPVFWNKYFQSYDKIVGFNDGYIGIFLRMNSHLPQGGRILDVGAGTGHASLLLSLMARDRRIMAVDISDHGLTFAKRKVLSAEPDFATLQESLIRLDQGEFADGAFMNNVLYRLSDKEAAMKRVFEALKPGARLVISDPKPGVALTVGLAKTFARLYVESVIEHGSEMTEFDLALIMRLNFGALMKAEHLLNPDQLVEMAEKVGFIAESREESYYGIVTLIVLKKPLDAVVQRGAG